MAAARAIFLSHMTAYYDAAHHESIVAREPSERRENARARAMRNGLAVICFSILKDFLRRRTQEILGHIGQAGVRFGILPEALRRTLTVSALGAVGFQLRVADPGRDDVQFAQRMAQQVASTIDSPFEACELSFGYEGSNLTEGAIKELLESLGVEKPWESLGHVADLAGIGSLKMTGARRAFDDLARRRHEAAHSPEADVQPSDLKSAYLNALGLALGFDSLASRAALEFAAQNRAIIQGKEMIRARDITLYFMDFKDGRGFGVKKQEAKRYYRYFGDEAEALAFCRESSRRAKGFFVVRDARGIPMRWDIVGIKSTFSRTGSTARRVGAG